MAERRMISKRIINQDKFILLPATAQALYMHLLISADDDGFTEQIATSIFQSHASLSDLQALIDTGYIYYFDVGIVVIVHWLTSNSIRKDRYTPTIYRSEYSQLKQQNNVYILSSDGCHAADRCLPQDNLEEIKEEKRYESNLINNQQATHHQSGMHTKEELCPFFEELWRNYPNKKGKNKITDNALIRMNEIGYEKMLNAVKTYKEEVADTDVKYIKHGNTFFNGDFEEYIGRESEKKNDAVLESLNIVPVFNTTEVKNKF